MIPAGFPDMVELSLLDPGGGYWWGLAKGRAESGRYDHAGDTFTIAAAGRLGVGWNEAE